MAMDTNCRNELALRRHGRKKQPNRINEPARFVFRINRIECDQWWENSFPDPVTLSCSRNGYDYGVDAVCSNVDALGELCGNNEREVLGKLACSKQEPEHNKALEQVHSKALEQVHSKAQGQVLEHSKPVPEQVHSKELVLELEHNMVLELVQVHSKVLVPELEHNKALEQVHSKALVQVHSKELVLGKLACSNAHALGGCEVARTNFGEVLGNKQALELGSSHCHHG